MKSSLVKSLLHTSSYLFVLSDDLGGGSADSKLANLLVQIFAAMRDEQIRHLKKLFDGSFESFLALDSAIDNGALVNADYDQDWNEINTNFKRSS